MPPAWWVPPMACPSGCVGGPASAPPSPSRHPPLPWRTRHDELKNANESCPIRPPFFRAQCFRTKRHVQGYLYQPLWMGVLPIPYLLQISGETPSMLLWQAILLMSKIVIVFLSPFVAFDVETRAPTSIAVRPWMKHDMNM